MALGFSKLNADFKIWQIFVKLLRPSIILKKMFWRSGTSLIYFIYFQSSWLHVAQLSCVMCSQLRCRICTPPQQTTETSAWSVIQFLHQGMDKCQDTWIISRITQSEQHTVNTNIFTTSSLALKEINKCAHRLYTGIINSLTNHYTDVIMSVMASQITHFSVLYSTICSGADQRKH